MSWSSIMSSSRRRTEAGGVRATGRLDSRDGGKGPVPPIPPRLPVLPACCGSRAARSRALEASQRVRQATFGGLPVPGATVSALRGEKQVTTTTDQGVYRFADLAGAFPRG